MAFYPTSKDIEAVLINFATASSQSSLILGKIKIMHLAFPSDTASYKLD